MDHVLFRSLHALIAASLCLAVPACDDDGAELEADDDERNFAAATFYSCKTAMRDPSTGTDWYYETTVPFNNTSPSTKVMVSWNSNSVASGLAEPLTLPKIGTDTFSDDSKLTLRLQQKKNGTKGIRIDHHTIGRTANVENSYCTTTTVDTPTHKRHDFFYGGKTAINGSWHIYKLAEQRVDAGGLDAGVEFDVPHTSDPYQLATGLMSYLQSCDVMAQAGYYNTFKDDVTTGTLTTGLLGFVHLALGTASAIECLQNSGHTVGQAAINPFLGSRVDKHLPLGMDALKQACGTGSDTLYFNHYKGGGPYQTLTSSACVQLFQPTDPNKNKPYMRMKVMSSDLKELSEWATLIQW